MSSLAYEDMTQSLIQRTSAAASRIREGMRIADLLGQHLVFARYLVESWPHKPDLYHVQYTARDGRVPLSLPRPRPGRGVHEDLLQAWHAKVSGSRAEGCGASA